MSNQVPNPFPALESLKEHIDGAWVALALKEHVDPRMARQVFGNRGVGYHLAAAEELCGRLYQTLARALPGACALDEREVTDTIMDQIDAPPAEGGKEEGRRDG